MGRATVFALLFGTAAFVCAAPVPPENDAARLSRIFGTKSDPSENAKYEMDGEKLRITATAWEALANMPRNAFGRPIFANRFPDLRPEGAPRVWREVAGDFAVIVRVG